MSETDDGPHRPSPRRRHADKWLIRLLTVAAIVAGLLVAGCTTERIGDVPSDSEPGDVTNGDEGGERRVDLEVISDPRGAVLAFAPVFIGGEGPYMFALDTGASHSLIDRRVVDELGLEMTGEAQQVTGIVGAQEAELVSVPDWSLGDVTLPEIEMVTLELSQTDSEQVPDIQGLLGSDILSTFGTILIDYDEATIVLRAEVAPVE